MAFRVTFEWKTDSKLLRILDSLVLGASVGATHPLIASKPEAKYIPPLLHIKSTFEWTPLVFVVTR